jgi:phosphoribosylaminoimidazole-succinocarboxamide synthase
VNHTKEQPVAHVITRTELTGYPLRRGKVRDVYDLGDRLLIVASDRLSAFDVVLPTPIPEKGRILTLLSAFWFEHFAPSVPHHLLEVIDRRLPPGLDADLGLLSKRSMLCRKCEVVPIECVVRGYLAGSGWRDYLRCGSVCGVELPAGLKLCGQLPEPVFTPSTKAEVGHDENISFDQACARVGERVMHTLRERSLAIYSQAARFAAQRGVIIADTKLEWGRLDGQLILLDELLTPDSSRFWPMEGYAPGREQDSFDKQYVRNYLQELCDAGRWDKTAPGPELPDAVVRQTTARYIEAYERLTGRPYARS